ncbi:MAG: CDP-alcohol phosphatidyltransferase family protein [Azospirillaceae bacterium]|nr:CDP-alcohol phosphatidyltransferase family protein [Azospirillaceae bacterium]
MSLRPVVYLPNLITLARLAAVPLAVWSILAGRPSWAFWLFVAAGVSDGVDGFIARAFRARTALGAILDPIADKALLVSVFLALGYRDAVPVWLVSLVFSRDAMIVTGVVLLQARRVLFAIEPIFVSKLNTALQILLVAVVLAVNGDIIGDPVVFGTGLSRLLVWLVSGTVIVSGACYIVRGIQLYWHRDPA